MIMLRTFISSCLMMVVTNKQSIYLYGGSINIDFYPDSHRYKLGKENLPSVTGIIWQYSKWDILVYWATNLARDYLLEMPTHERTDMEVVNACNQHKIKKKEAWNVGTIVHDWCEAWAKWEKPIIPLDEQAKNGVLAFLQRVNEHNVEFIETETIAYSKKYWYVGKFDAIAIVDGKRYIIDYKTSKYFHVFETGMQLSAYANSIHEERGDEHWIMGIHIDKNTWDFTTYDMTEDKDDLFKVFLPLVAVKTFKKALDAKLKKYEPTGTSK